MRTQWWLMLLMAYLLRLSKSWRSAKIHLKTLIDDESLYNEREQALLKICEETEFKPIVKYWFVPTSTVSIMSLSLILRTQLGYVGCPYQNRIKQIVSLTGMDNWRRVGQCHLYLQLQSISWSIDCRCCGNVGLTSCFWFLGGRYSSI